MNRLLSHQPSLNPHPAQKKQKQVLANARQPLSIKTNPASAPAPATTDAKMSPTDYNSAKPLPLPQPGFHSSPKRSHSPHIVDQALSRKPVAPVPVAASSKPGSAETSASDFARYHFDHSPTTSTPAHRLSSSSPLANTDLEMDPSVRLEEYDWPDLELQFDKSMVAFKEVESALWDEWKTWNEVFGAWASTVSVHDEERARKRLRTRMAFTKGREGMLEDRRMHYVKVVQAFEGALALLGDG